MVSWRQLPDRLAVTYENVEDWEQRYRISAQLELFFDGRIRMTWLGSTGVAAPWGIVGLSRGEGRPVLFEESDFTRFAPATLTVTTPNGGEVWQTGRVEAIMWMGETVVEPYVRIGLHDGASFLGWLTLRTENDGAWSYVVRSDMPAGANYRVRIQSYADPGVRDLSDLPFTIETAPLAVSSPARNAVWTAGAIETIAWTGDIVAVGPHVRVGLHEGAAFLGWLALRTDNDGAFNWLIPDTWTAGGEYRVRVQSYHDANVRAFSDGRFEVKAAPLALTAPRRGDVWSMGTIQTVQWRHAEGEAGAEVRLALHRDGGFLGWVNRRTDNDGVYCWLIPEDLEPGGGYRMRVQSYEDAAIRDFSPWFSIVSG